MRIASPKELQPAIRAAGYEAVLLPELPDYDIQRPFERRLADGDIFLPFFERHDIDLVVDFDAGALTLTSAGNAAGQVALTTAACGIPYAACFIDPITSTMQQAPWEDRWALAESRTWIKAVWDTAHARELGRLGIPNVLTLPMAVVDDDFDTRPLPDPGPGPVAAFMGHPASSFFRSQNAVMPGQMVAAMTAAAVAADSPGTPFHKTYYDLYGFADPPCARDDPSTRARKAGEYFSAKFLYNAYLAIKQRDRFAIFLKRHLQDRFELIGDYWDTNYGLPHTPRIWDVKELHERMRRVPICLNLVKGNVETSVILRHFEVTGYGGFLLTYPTPELSSFFEIGKECEVFHDEHDLLDKIRYYEDHAKERREIAAAGQRRTLSEHLYSHRITQLVEMLRAGELLRPAASGGVADAPGPRIHVNGVPACT